MGKGRRNRRLAVSDTGFRYPFAPTQVNQRPMTAVPGAHMWCVVVLYLVNPDSELHMLDRENLTRVDGPACFVCQQDYSPEVASRPCPGWHRSGASTPR